MDIFVVNEVQSMLTHDAFLFTHPVTLNKVRSVVDIEKVFDSVSYLKGGALVRMLYHIMTPDLFQKAIRDYLQQNSLKSVTEDDLWDSLGSVQNELELDLPTDIAEIMYFWTHEAGFPLLMVERDEDGSINLTQ
ncbi:aminopeptidase N-like, partial [Nilaparvata lugens]|uniref:aminopeptidase N-like n=1 Tax=Nilaparvata lugens TaxID=108931 RepID=UPI00193D0963